MFACTALGMHYAARSLGCTTKDDIELCCAIEFDDSQRTANKNIIGQT